jgi:glycosyltransferase involved in cell wall biosynthesis
MVTVIIPVYNAEKYLRKAVKSALDQPEVSEIILVEDASPDNALFLCQELQNEYPGKIKLLQHPDKKNHGAGASRNLGIANARNEYIAFLDADDYYLPGRFRNDIKVLQEQPDVDGIYNALGTDILDESERERALVRYGEKQLTTVSYPIPPEVLFEEMVPIGNQGWFHLNCTTLRKRVFETVGMFETRLRLTQDTHLFLKLAAKCRLAPGIIDKPLSMRGVHSENRIRDDIKLRDTKPLLFKLLLEWMLQNDISAKRKQIVWKALYRSIMDSYMFQSMPLSKQRWKRYTFLFKSIKYDFLRKHRDYYDTLPIIRNILHL